MLLQQSYFLQFPELLYVVIIFSFNVLCHVIFIFYCIFIDVQPVCLCEGAKSVGIGLGIVMSCPVGARN